MCRYGWKQEKNHENKSQIEWWNDGGGLRQLRWIVWSLKLLWLRSRRDCEFYGWISRFIGQSAFRNGRRSPLWRRQQKQHFLDGRIRRWWCERWWCRSNRERREICFRRDQHRWFRTQHFPWGSPRKYDDVEPKRWIEHWQCSSDTFRPDTRSHGQRPWPQRVGRSLRQWHQYNRRLGLGQCPRISQWHRDNWTRWWLRLRLCGRRRRSCDPEKLRIVLTHRGWSHRWPADLWHNLHRWWARLAPASQCRGLDQYRWWCLHCHRQRVRYRYWGLWLHGWLPCGITHHSTAAQAIAAVAEKNIFSSVRTIAALEKTTDWPTFFPLGEMSVFCL